ncbi:MAG: cell wall metabolism sensor histidine kinase WalK [Lactobacillaceae bacterium]|jgi:two-component system sensor histidine kinase VicK|nr:cell wall metabolism sensor histidine kinase WalK [Lactobacillaceae bacterium]
MKELFAKIKIFVNLVHIKIALIFTLVTLTTIGIFGIIFIGQLQNQMIDSVKEQAFVSEDTRKQLLANLINPNEKSGNSEVNSTLSTVTGIGSNDSIIVIDGRGIIRGANSINMKQNVTLKYTSVLKTKNIIKNISKAISNKKFKEEMQLKVNGNPYFISTARLKENDKIIGIILYVADMSATYENISNITKLFIGSMLIPILAAAGVSFMISRWFSNPIENISNQTKQLINGHYQVLNSINSNDEIGNLAKNINELSVSLMQEKSNSQFERDRLDSLLSNMTDGVISVDRNGKVLVVNITAGELLNLIEDDIVDKQIQDILKLEDNKISFRELLEKPKGIILKNIENQNLVLKVTSSLIRRKSGFITGAVLVIRDVTLETKLELEQKNFVSNVSHELRTPLTSVNSYIETLQDGKMPPVKIVRQFLNVAHNETQRMIRMINDLLELSRIDQKTLKLEKEFINISRYIDHILNRFDIIVEQGNAEHDKKYNFVKKYKISNIFVDIDPDRFMQVMDNIINNAIKYSPNGSAITVDIKKIDDKVRISIIDKGLGIPKKDIKNIFNRFYRVDKARARKQGGSGLGLAISKEVVEALNGTIWAESSEGKGTTMFIELPIVKQ